MTLAQPQYLRSVHHEQTRQAVETILKNIENDISNNFEDFLLWLDNFSPSHKRGWEMSFSTLFDGISDEIGNKETILSLVQFKLKQIGWNFLYFQYQLFDDFSWYGFLYPADIELNIEV